MAQDFEKFQMILQELVRRTNDTNVRLRSLEQRMQGLEERMHSSEGNNLDKMRRLHDKSTGLDARLRNINDELVLMKNNLERITRQASRFAMKKDIKEVEHMFDLLSPAGAEKKE